MAYIKNGLSLQIMLLSMIVVVNTVSCPNETVIDPVFVPPGTIYFIDGKEETWFQRTTNINYSKDGGLTVVGSDQPYGHDSVHFISTPVFYDLSYFAANNGKISLMLFVNNASAITSGQIEFNSSNVWDTMEHSWDIIPNTIQNGWNTIDVSMASANKTPDADWGNIIWIRLYLSYSTQGNSAKIMYFRCSTGGN